MSHRIRGCLLLAGGARPEAGPSRRLFWARHPKKSRGWGAWRGVAWRGQLLIDFRPPRAANAPARVSIPTSSRNPEGALELPLPSLCIFASSPSSLQYSAFILFSPRLTHLARRRVCLAWTARLSLHRHSIIIPPPSRRAPREHPPNPPATQRLREPSPHPHCSSDAAQSPEVFWRNNRPSDATRRCTSRRPCPHTTKETLSPWNRCLARDPPVPERHQAVTPEAPFHAPGPRNWHELPAEGTRV